MPLVLSGSHGSIVQFPQELGIQASGDVCNGPRTYYKPQAEWD